MDQKKLAALRERLLAERAQLTANQDDMTIAQNDDDQDDVGVTNHPADEATDVFLRERNIALNNNASEIVAEIDAALERMDNGTYGLCARCGKPISEERLEALPYARYDIDCQAIIEQENAA